MPIEILAAGAAAVLALGLGWLVVRRAVVIGPGQVVALAGLAGLPLLAVALAGLIAPMPTPVVPPAVTAPPGAEAHDGVNEMVATLAQRLQETPDDAPGWALLARSLVSLDRHQEALVAYDEAIRLTEGADSNLLGEYAEARVVAGGGEVDAQAQDAFRTVAARTPDDPRARYYLALALAQAGDVAGALQAWQALLAASPPDAPWRAAVEAQIAAAEAE